MKKFITLALIIGTTTFIQAQSNLVFNQVLNFNIGNRESVTVPEGKVWKLESGISQGDVLISSINQEYGNNLDSSNMDAYALQTYNMPMWLGQGTTLTLINGSDNFLSILEFNVVPISSSGSGGSVGGVSADGFIVNGLIDLDFSYVNNNGTIGGSVDMGSLIVPEGKIWKIVNSNFNGSTNSGDIPGSGFGGNVYVNNYLVTGEEKPIYLAAGTYQVFGVPAASGGGGTYYYTVKVGGIEYNTN